MKKKKSQKLFQLITNLCVNLENLENSLTVILGTPECSCEHKTVEKMKESLHQAIEILRD